MIFKIKLHWQILIALVAAVAFGYFLPNLVQWGVGGGGAGSSANLTFGISLAH